MNISNLRSQLKKFKTQELLHLIKQINCLANLDLELNLIEEKYQKEIIESILTVVSKNNLIDEVYEEIDLINAHTEDKKRLWTVYEFDHDADGHFPDTVIEISDNLKERFHLALHSLYNYKMICKQQYGALWFRISIRPFNSKRKSPLIIYMVYFAFTAFVILTSAPDKIRDIILILLAEEFSFPTKVKRILTGHCIQSLMQLVINQENLKYKLDLFFPNPLLTSDLSQENHSKTVSAEDDKGSSKERNDDSLRNEYLLKIFGPNRLPKLQLLHYEVETNIESKKTSETDNFNYTVTFNGPSVLDGIKEMVAKGIADYPLPKHFSKVPKSGVNRFKLSKKK